MSDLSCPHCRRCRQPDYACQCEAPEWMDSVVNILMGGITDHDGKQPPRDHPFFDTHPNLFERTPLPPNKRKGSRR